MKPDLSIIIISYNTRAILDTCLKSVFKEIRNFAKPTEVIVIDNGSRDDSVKFVETNYPQIKLIQNKENKGFGTANNQGIMAARAKLVLLLNSDVELHQNSLTNAYKKLDSNKAQIVGCKLVNKDGSLQQSVGYFPTPLRIFYWMFFVDDIWPFKSWVKPYHITDANFYKKDQIVDWVTGAFFLADKKTLINCGLFDPKVFMYVEEVELCYRIKLNGGTLIYTPAGSVTHLKGASAEGTNAGLLEEFKGILYFYQKHLEFKTKLIKYLLLLGALLRTALFAIIGDKEKRALYAKITTMVRR